MRTVVVRNGARIPLGKQGENNAVRVVWPRIAEKYAELYGDGRFELVAVQKGQAYPAVVSVDGADLIWNVLAADVAIAEVGSLELIYYVGDTIAKSQTWETFVEVSKSAEGTTEPPEPAKNWVDGVIKSSSDAKQSATESAESARQSAESATNAAASATKAENAVGHSPIIGENGNWFIWDFEKSEYVDSGKSASTPPIIPETAGKYLTNDGRKAEWGAIDVPQSDWEQTDESAADYVKNRPFGNFAHHSIDFYYSGDYQWRVKKAPTFNELVNTVGEKTARLEADGSIYCQGTAVTVLDEVYGDIKITFTSDDKLNELVFSGRYGSLTSLTINKSNITWDTLDTYSLFIDGLTYTRYQKLSRSSVEGTLPEIYRNDYILISSVDGSWYTRSIESINPIFQLSGASAGQIVKITAVDESGKPTAWEAVDMPTGGADPSLGITGATVGQIAKITAVDTDGKPTEWEAVDVAGGETWEKIADIELRADTALYVLADFAVWRKAKVIMRRPKYVSGLKKNVWCNVVEKNFPSNQYYSCGYLTSEYGYVYWDFSAEVSNNVISSTTLRNNNINGAESVKSTQTLTPINLAPTNYEFTLDFVDTSVIQEGDKVTVIGVRR